MAPLILVQMSRSENAVTFIALFISTPALVQPWPGVITSV